MKCRIKEKCYEREDRSRKKHSRQVDIEHEDDKPKDKPLQRQDGHETDHGAESKSTGDLSRSLAGAENLNKVLDEFQLAGMLGMSIDSEGYTPFQLNIIEKWYNSGIETYDPNESIYLLAILESKGIKTK